MYSWNNLDRRVARSLVLTVCTDEFEKTPNDGPACLPPTDRFCHLHGTTLRGDLSSIRFMNGHDGEAWGETTWTGGCLRGAPISRYGETTGGGFLRPRSRSAISIEPDG